MTSSKARGYVRTLLLIVVLAVVGWYYFIGGRRISEDQLSAFYQKQTEATLSRNPEALCVLLADDFEGHSSGVVYGQRVAVTQNKEQTCDSYRQMYSGIAEIGDKLGGIAQLDYQHDIDEVSISADRKSATASVRYTLNVAGSVMRYRGRSKDILVRRAGRVLLQSSEEESSVSGGNRRF
jgi:Domain of unknown function (DUF4440)